VSLGNEFRHLEVSLAPSYQPLYLWVRGLQVQKRKQKLQGSESFSCVKPKPRECENMRRMEEQGHSLWLRWGRQNSSRYIRPVDMV